MHDEHEALKAFHAKCMPPVVRKAFKMSSALQESDDDDDDDDDALGI